jgi:pimeloyl-ACP methyl ester carboxylesterase
VGTDDRSSATRVIDDRGEQGTRSTRSSRRTRRGLGLGFALVLGAAHVTVADAAPVLPTPTAPITSVPCPPPADAAICGTIQVQADRTRPERGSMTVFFRLYQAANATGVVVPRQGGPGAASTAPQFVSRVRGVMNPLFGSGWSILFVDQRGRGGSNAINCPDLQANGLSESGVIACAASLVDASGIPGSGADLYSTAASADDLEDVRRALVASGRIPDVPIDLFGQSYGGIDLEAYAARYPQQVRSMVGDSPYSSSSDFFGVRAAGSFVESAVHACRLNAGCRTDRDDIEKLVRALRRSPLTGTGTDLTGMARQVTGDELAVLYSVIFNQPTPLVAQLGAEFLNQGEIGAAARAYRRGDTAPLLRLLAENADLLIPAGSPLPFTRNSFGNLVATQCADQTSAPWTWGGPNAAAEYQAALDRVRSSSIAPFSRSAWSAFSTAAAIGGSMCVPWPTSPIEALPAGSPLTSAPVLALSPSLDNAVPPASVTEWANRYPNARVAVLTGRGHIPAVRADACAQSIIRSFIASPSAALNLACASTPQILPLATPDFPVKVSHAAEAKVDRSARTDRSTSEDRRVATVSVATTLDALKRFTMAANPASSSTGLRGGVVSGRADALGVVTVTLTGARFVGDLSVSGTATWNPSTFALTGTLTVARPNGQQVGSLTVAGTWRMPGGAPLQVRGTLGGRTVALLVPAT